MKNSQVIKERGKFALKNDKGGVNCLMSFKNWNWLI